MVSIGYPAHVGEDFVMLLKQKRKNRLQYVRFALDTTAMAMNALLEHVLIPLIFTLCGKFGLNLSVFQYKAVYRKDPKFLDRYA